MPAANIQINAVTATSAIVPVNVAVQLSNADTGGEVSYAWTILDQPEGTPIVSLSNPAIENPTFTPTREGTYRLRLVVNATLPTEVTAYAEVQIPQVISGQIIPAAGEMLEADATRGWATRVIRSLQDVDRLVGDSNVVVCISQGSASVGQVVQLGFQGIATYLTGLPGSKRALVSRPATPVEEVDVNGRLGQIIAVCDGGSIADGKPVLVRLFGLSPFTVTTADSPSVGDWVFIDPNGMPFLKWDPTATDVPRIVGRVVEFSGGKFRWMIDPVPMHRRVVMPANAQIWDGTTGWSRAGYGAAIAYWLASTNTATGLVYPLPVEPNEEIVYLQAEVNLSGPTAEIQARLRVGSLASGDSLLSDWASSPAVTGGAVWNIDVLVGAIAVMPHLIGKGYGAQLEFQTAGGGGGRELGIVTVWTTPVHTA